MARIHQFARYSNSENFATNNTLLLLGRVYQHDRLLFEHFLNALDPSVSITIGPQFEQQVGAGGKGIPDAVINQRSLKVIVETKLYDRHFWGKEEYSSHFKNEDSRILLAISIDKMVDDRQQNIRAALRAYDQESNAQGVTSLVATTFSELISTLREVISQSRSRAQLELEEILLDYEDFAYGLGLISDVQYRMHVFAINTSEEDNQTYTLYYNQADRRERPHRFIGLYRNKTVKYIAEVDVVVIPVRDSITGIIEYNVLKGSDKFNNGHKAKLDRFFSDEGWGDDGRVKFHLFERLLTTDFQKSSPYGIMGPRHFDLRDHIDKMPSNFDVDWVATELTKISWE